MSRTILIAWGLSLVYAALTGAIVATEIKNRSLNWPPFSIPRLCIWPLEIVWVILIEIPYQWAKRWIQEYRASRLPSADEQGEG